MKVFFRRRKKRCEPFAVEVPVGVTRTELANLLQKHLQSTSPSEIPPQQLIFNKVPIEYWSDDDWNAFTQPNDSQCMNTVDNPMKFADAFQTLWVKAVATNIQPQRKAEVESFEVTVASHQRIIHLRQAIMRKQFEADDYFTYGTGVPVVPHPRTTEPTGNDDFLCNILRSTNSVENPVMFEDDHAYKLQRLAEELVDLILTYYPPGTTHIKKSFIDAHAQSTIKRYRKMKLI